MSSEAQIIDHRGAAIRRRAALCAALILAASVRWISGAAPTDSIVTSQPAETVAPAAPSGPEMKYVGVGGCAAAACHGGALPADPERLWNCSYTIWASQDPLDRLVTGEAKADHAGHKTAPLIDKHNRACAVLYDDKSKQIIKLLDHLASAKDAKPQLDNRCVACHSVPLDAAAVPAAIRADGVGCEMCHGPAKNWLTAHTANDWLAGYHAGEFKPLTDMNDTRSLLSRARICPGCHVGAASTDSNLLRDMNHDLIAAGHPRLNFAFHAFLGVVPKHWTDTPGAKAAFKTDRQTHAEAWAIGQVVAAEAALRLLADRAKPKSAAADKNRLRPWPEFSEYDCYACHHQLEGKYPSGRQAAAGKSSHKSGQLSWGSWYFPELEVLLSCMPSKECSERYAALTEAMSVPPSNLNRDEVAEKANAAATALHNFADQLGNKTFAPAEIDGLLLFAAGKEFQPADWDAAAERFLTLDALWKAREQFRGDRPSRPDEQLAAEAVEKLRQQLEFKPGFDSPKGFNIESFRTECFQPAAAQIRQALSAGDSK